MNHLLRVLWQPAARTPGLRAAGRTLPRACSPAAAPISRRALSGGRLITLTGIGAHGLFAWYSRI